MTPEIVREGRFSLHVYGERGGKHHLPHVHIRRHDGSPGSVVSLPLLNLIVGPEPSSAERTILVDSLPALVAKWSEFNE
ncbi:MAG: hypothetical protein ACYDHH_32245 [Solirubrobacteraceae bacterium]